MNNFCKILHKSSTHLIRNKVMSRTRRVVDTNTHLLFVLLVFINISNCFSAVTKCEFNILDYGAIGDASHLNTKNIQATIDACAEAGGGRVLFPAGTYVSGTLILKDNVHLFLMPGSTILASTSHVDFPVIPKAEYRSQKDSNGWYTLIYGKGLSNIGISGSGTIDGNGFLQKPRPGLKKGDTDGRPRNLLLISCNQINIRGILMKNSGVWNQHYLNCEDVTIDNIKVYNHSNRNNDAIDIDGCRRVTISNSILDSDDDGITLKSTGIASTEDVTITNCIVSSYCNAIKAGTESTGGFKNITISNCVIRPSRSIEKPVFNTSTHGITGISLEIVDGGSMNGVAIDNVTIEGTDCPLYIRLGNRGRKHIDEAPEPKVGHMKNITISNLIAYDTGNYSNSITAIPGSYIENVILQNIQIYNKGGVSSGDYLEDYTQVPEKEKAYPQPTVWGNLPSSLFFVRHVKNLILNDLMFGSETLDSRIPIIGLDVHNVSIGNSIYTGGSTNKVFSLWDTTGFLDVKTPMAWTASTKSIINKKK